MSIWEFEHLGPILKIKHLGPFGNLNIKGQLRPLLTTTSILEIEHLGPFGN